MEVLPLCFFFLHHIRSLPHLWAPFARVAMKPRFRFSSSGKFVFAPPLPPTCVPTFRFHGSSHSANGPNKKTPLPRPSTHACFRPLFFHSLLIPPPSRRLYFSVPSLFSCFPPDNGLACFCSVSFHIFRSVHAHARTHLYPYLNLFSPFFFLFAGRRGFMHPTCAFFP